MINIACGLDSSAVIVQSLPDKPKRAKKKRIVTMQELSNMSETQIAAENEALLNANKEEQENKRVAMDMRFRNKLSQMIYGVPAAEKPAEKPVENPVETQVEKQTEEQKTSESGETKTPVQKQ